MCKCLAAVNEKLAEFNTRVESTIIVGNGTLQAIGVKLAVVRTDGTKKRPMSVTAAYCPFCGEKYNSGGAQSPDPAKE